MKTLKYLILLLVILFITGAVYFSLKDGHYSITEEKIVNAPASLLYEQIADFQNWKNWNPWLEDPNVSNTMGDVTTGIGGNYIFTDEYGKGSMEIIDLVPRESVVAIMNYDAGITQSESVVTMKLESVENGTKVIWNITGEDDLKSKVFNFIFGLDLEKELRPMYQKGLHNLEKVINNKMNRFSITQPKIIQRSGGFLIYKDYVKTTQNEDTAELSALKLLQQFMFNNDIVPYGKPLHHHYIRSSSKDSLHLSVGYPLQEKIEIPLMNDIQIRYIKPTEAVKISLTGDHKYIEDTRKTAYNYITMSDLELSTAAPFEIYLNEISDVENPALLKTDFYVPIITTPND